jgi:hypothetical protein
MSILAELPSYAASPRRNLDVARSLSNTACTLRASTLALDQNTQQ